MNKKAYDYGMFLILIAFIGLVSVYIQLADKQSDVERVIGKVQAPVLEASSQALFFDAFLARAAILAQDVAKEELYNSGVDILAREPSDFSQICTTLNSKESPKEVILPNVYPAFKKSFVDVLDMHFARLSKETSFKTPSNNFVLYFKGDKLGGAALAPVIYSTGDGKVDAAFRPKFEVDLIDDVKNYDSIMANFKLLAAACVYQANPLDCAKKNQPSWEIGMDENSSESLISLKVPLPIFRTLCHKLYLPAKQITPQAKAVDSKESPASVEPAQEST